MVLALGVHRIGVHVPSAELSPGTQGVHEKDESLTVESDYDCQDSRDRPGVGLELIITLSTCPFQHSSKHSRSVCAPGEAKQVDFVAVSVEIHQEAIRIAYEMLKAPAHEVV